MDAEQPTVTVEARYSKHRRKDILPLHAELVILVREWIKDLKPNEKLFPDLEKKKTWFMVKKDLQRVGIPYQNDDGIAGFHATGRHTHITELLRNGASLPEAQKLARHTDVKTTMRYTHIGLGDQARAVAKLPTKALQMRCISGVSQGHSMSSSGKVTRAKERQNPCIHKGFDVDCLELSTFDKVEDRGVEPQCDLDVSRESATRCACGQQPSAANALHLADPNWLRLTSIDARLQSVVHDWEILPESIKNAILALVESQNPGGECHG